MIAIPCHICLQVSIYPSVCPVRSVIHLRLSLSLSPLSFLGLPLSHFLTLSDISSASLVPFTVAWPLRRHTGLEHSWCLSFHTGLEKAFPPLYLYVCPCFVIVSNSAYLGMKPLCVAQGARGRVTLYGLHTRRFCLVREPYKISLPCLVLSSPLSCTQPFTGPLALGDIEESADTGGRCAVVCPWHGWTFALQGGEMVNIPEVVQPTFAVTITDDCIYVETEPNNM